MGHYTLRASPDTVKTQQEEKDNTNLRKRVLNATISGNGLSSSAQRDQIYTTDGRIERLSIDGGKLDVENSPAVIRNIRSVDGFERDVQVKK